MHCVSHSLFIQGATTGYRFARYAWALDSEIHHLSMINLTTGWNLEFNQFSQCERISMMTKEKPVSMSSILLVHYNIQTALWLQKDF